MINCLDIAKNTAWDCRVIDSGTLELSTPVTFYDGSAVPVYVLEMGGGAVEITDDGGFKEHLATCGLDAALDTRRLSTLERAVSKWGVSFDESLSMIAKEDELQYAFQRYLGALFDAARWQLDILKLPPDNNALIQEVRMYLMALNPSQSIQTDVQLRGISGKFRQFPIKLNSTFYDAVGTHPASSAAMVKKLYDVTSSPGNSAVQITVVVDDRKDVEQAKSDIQIYSGLAHVNKISALQRQAMGAMPSAH